jgi:hypothetical protein
MASSPDMAEGHDEMPELVKLAMLRSVSWAIQVPASSDFRRGVGPSRQLGPQIRFLWRR